jgi:hypothetical protein
MTLEENVFGEEFEKQLYVRMASEEISRHSLSYLVKNMIVLHNTRTSQKLLKLSSGQFTKGYDQIEHAVLNCIEIMHDEIGRRLGVEFRYEFKYQRIEDGESARDMVLTFCETFCDCGLDQLSAIKNIEFFESAKKFEETKEFLNGKINPEYYCVKEVMQRAIDLCYTVLEDEF